MTPIQLNQQEEEKIDPSWIPIDQIKHCSHYQRWCEKQAPCCKKYYPCRLCHNELYKGPKGPGCKVETMARQEVTLIKCKRCLKEQAPQKQCEQCNITFGRYYCDICKFYDDEQNKDIYHCVKCNMCRRGVADQNFHCDTCNICLNKSLLKSHRCIQEAFIQDCPICQMNLKESVTGVIQLSNCSHWIHQKCFTQYIQKSGYNRCPICNTALDKMSKEQIQVYDKLVVDTSSHLPAEVKNMKVSIQCLECHKQSKDLPFHFYLKCQHCGSYNTKE